MTFVSSIQLTVEFSRIDFGTIFGTSISIGAKVTSNDENERHSDFGF